MTFLTIIFNLFSQYYVVPQAVRNLHGKDHQMIRQKAQVRFFTRGIFSKHDLKSKFCFFYFLGNLFGPSLTITIKFLFTIFIRVPFSPPSSSQCDQIGQNFAIWATYTFLTNFCSLNFLIFHLLNSLIREK